MQTKEISLASFSKPGDRFHIRKKTQTVAGEIPHSHDCFQILYVTKGSMRHSHPGMQVKLEAGDAFIVPPGYEHTTRVDRQWPAEFYTVYFQEDLFYPGFTTSSAYKFLSALVLNVNQERQHNVRMRVTMRAQDQQQMETLLTCLLEEYENGWDRENTTAGSLIAAILILLSRAYFSGQTGEQELEIISQSQDAIVACMHYIDANYMHDLKLDDLAKRFALSRSAFVLLFSQMAGMPVKRYINQKRIEQATALCTVPSLSIKEISMLVGYQDLSTFYRNFKKQVGMSPAEYREILQQSDV